MLLLLLSMIRVGQLSTEKTGEEMGIASGQDGQHREGLLQSLESCRLPNHMV